MTTTWRAEFRVLGPVEVLRDGEALPALPAQQRTVLAVLLMAEGVAVPVDRLVDAVWGEQDVTKDRRNNLQVYVSRLRRLLAAADGVRIDTEGRHGYRMQVPPDAVDVRRFRMLVAEAGAAEDERAALLLGEALALWRGAAFGGAAGDWVHRQLAPALDEECLAARERRAATLGRLDRHGEVTVELSTLVAEHPTRETLAASLMDALHECGRTAEALAVFADLRARLAEELGVDPGEPVRAVHARILAASDPGPGAGAAVPAQLPGTPATFVGRADLTEALAAQLTSGPADARRVVLVTGVGGTGKSSIAAHAAHRVRGDFPDGQLYAALDGAGAAPADPAELLADFLRTLGVPAHEVPANADRRAALYRSLLADRAVLVLLDDARDAAQVRPLLPASARSAVLLTSRSRLAALELTHRLRLGGLSVADSVRLLAAVIGTERVAAEHADARRLVALCGYLPLALRIAAGRLAQRPRWRLAVLCQRLRDERDGLDELALDDLDVRASFLLSYRQLEPAAARAFRLWSLSPAGSLPDGAAAEMLGAGERQADGLTDALLDLHLVHSDGEGRVRMHQLLRRLGRDLCAGQHTDAERRDALGRLAGWYLHSLAAAVAAAVPGMRPARHLTPGAQRALSFADSRDALAWLDRERGDLVAVLVEAAGGTLLPPADLARAAVDFGRYAGPRGHLDQWRALAGSAADLAARFGDERAQARARVTLGAAALRDQEQAAAAEEIGKAAAALHGSGERTEATAAGNLALVYESMRRGTDAARQLQRAHDLYRAAGDVRGEANALDGLGRQSTVVGDYAAAVATCTRARERAATVGAVDVQALAAVHAADALRLSGDLAGARSEYGRAIRLADGTGNPEVEGACRAGLGRLRRAERDPAAAVTEFERATDAYRYGRFDAERSTVLGELGALLEQLGQPQRAAACRAELAGQ